MHKKYRVAIYYATITAQINNNQGYKNMTIEYNAAHTHVPVDYRLYPAIPGVPPKFIADFAVLQSMGFTYQWQVTQRVPLSITNFSDYDITSFEQPSGLREIVIPNMNLDGDYDITSKKVAIMVLELIA